MIPIKNIPKSLLPQYSKTWDETGKVVIIEPVRPEPVYLPEQGIWEWFGKREVRHHIKDEFATMLKIFSPYYQPETEVYVQEDFQIGSMVLVPIYDAGVSVNYQNNESRFFEGIEVVDILLSKYGLSPEMTMLPATRLPAELSRIKGKVEKFEVCQVAHIPLVVFQTFPPALDNGQLIDKRSHYFYTNHPGLWPNGLINLITVTK